ncbi:hypothetical protein [Rhizobium leguminosarum]|uniref:hypothetical protein n=1 Tax=Rhizobium TaxID=379 RepID=UPI001031DEC0|nr:hypothetical protein [Rhizobium leguminosarum]TBF81959.1 hypothetical protein ELG86_07350 [Rhizobium leguminosarum]TBH01449.1 hypothetical protein ELG70_07340 [Rhizobium leguminosarum]TBH10986.1 hypothetical protein ELG68_07400 [Rhizobium leguminosarum]TBH35729.1 hypothetical protein ELG66_07400 [Rhizobium leguminosarum]TBH66184.1 hypothetical protein ELG61_07355 [Rhizobium leguminosarum]
MNFKGHEFAAFVKDMKERGWGRFTFVGDTEATRIADELRKRKILASPVGGDIMWCNDKIWDGAYTAWGAFDDAQTRDANVSPEQFNIQQK